MAKITVVTLAYNPGEYIYPCVDSVLGQTFTDFEYVIIDNASSDGTKEVLEEYAKKDTRIRLYRNEENNVGSIKAVDMYVDTEYYMILDHDDYIEPDALECLYNAAQKENLDMVFGRCEMVDEKGRSLGEAGMQQELSCIIGENIGEYFDALYWQLRTQWGKLIRKSLTQYIDMETLKKRAASKYAGDTVVILSMAFAAKRLGTVGKILHHYRILDKSESRTYCRQRFLADWVLLDMARNLLQERGGLTPRNEIYLFRVYYSAICDTLRMAINSEVSDSEKIEVIAEIVTKGHTKEMRAIVEKYASEEYTAFKKGFGQAILSLYLKNATEAACRNLVFCWISLLCGEANVLEVEYSHLYEKRRAILLLLCLGQTEQAYRDMAETECPEYCPSLYLYLALRFEKNVKRMAQILIQAGSLRAELYQTSKNALRILAEQNGILRGIEESVLEENPDVVAAVCAEEYLVATNICLERLTLEKWQRSGGLLEVAISLAAIIGDANVFVMLKKCSCEFMLRENKIEQAKVVLLDLEEMCPGDEEVEMLKQSLL